MNMSFLTRIFGCTVALMTSSPAYAQQQTQMHSQQNGSYSQGHAMTEQQLSSGYNHPARIDVESSWDFYLRGDFIYWQPRAELVQLGFSNPSTNIASLPNVGGTMINMDFDWEPGFKTGVGLAFPRGDWDVYLEWTRLHMRDNISANSPPGGSITYLRLAVPSEIPMFSASQSWKMDIDLVDIELARSYYVGRHLTFRPFFSIRAGWLDQKLSNDSLFSSNGFPSVFSTKSDSWLLGPRAGIDTNWIFGYGFRMITNAATSLVYTRIKNRTEQNDVLNQVDFDLMYVIRSRGVTVAPNLEIAQGFGWGTYFDRNNWHFDLKALYEFHVFWNQVTFPADSNTPGNPGEGNLYFHGLTISASLDL